MKQNAKWKFQTAKIGVTDHSEVGHYVDAIHLLLTQASESDYHRLLTDLMITWNKVNTFNNN